MEKEKSVDLNEDLILCLFIETKKYQKKTGVCFFDYLNYEFLMTEFMDNEHFTVLESLFIQKRPSKCLIANRSDFVDEARLENLLSLCNIESIPIDKKLFDTSNLNQDLKMIIPHDDDARNYDKHMELSNACKCLVALISYLRDENLNIDNRCSVRIHNVELYMRLDKAATSALNILPNKKNFCSYNNNISLLKFLDKCKTSVGSKKLLSWLTQPLTDQKEINRRLDLVESLSMDEELRSSIYCQYLRGVPELDKLNHYLKEINQNENTRLRKNSKYNEEMILKDIVKLYFAILDLRQLYCDLLDYSGIHKETWKEMITHPLKDILNRFSKFLELIEATIDLEELKENREYLIQRKFDPALDKLTDEKRRIMCKIKDHKEDVEIDLFSEKSTNRRAFKEDVKLVDCNTNVFLFRVTKKGFGKLSDKKQTYISVRMNKNEFLFTTSILTRLSREYVHCLQEYNALQSKIVRNIISAVSTYTPVIENFMELVSTIDVLTSFSIVVSNSQYKYTRPKVIENGEEVILKRARHPLMELPYNLKNFMPNDIYMHKKKSRLVIITGPNMGGKSTYIRQAGIIFILAQVGMFVPCDYCEVPIFTQVLCRVGASDFQLKGISTFLAEMIEASAIVKNADEKSFIIIDELGRGTSTYEGLGISWAIAKYILDRIGCFCLFATHFHEISNIAFQCEGVVNRHVETTFDQKNQKIYFLYEIKEGPSNKSYGVNVAEIAKLPKEVIRKAYEKVEDLESAENKYYLNERLNACLVNNTNGATNHVGERGEEECWKSRMSNYIKMKEEMSYVFSSNNDQEFMERFMSKRSILQNLVL